LKLECTERAKFKKSPYFLITPRMMQCWFQKFRNGDESLEDKVRGHPSVVDNDELKVLIEANPRIAIREL